MNCMFLQGKYWKNHCASLTVFYSNLPSYFHEKIKPQREPAVTFSYEGSGVCFFWSEMKRQEKKLMKWNAKKKEKVLKYSEKKMTWDDMKFRETDWNLANW